MAGDDEIKKYVYIYIFYIYVVTAVEYIRVKYVQLI